MTCKDCLCSDVCIETRDQIQMLAYQSRNDVEKVCHNFKDKTQLVELPCKINERLYYANKTLDEVCEATVIRIDINYIEEPYIWLTLDYLTSRVGKCRHRGIADLMLNKTLFFTYEEAEKALERS